MKLVVDATTGEVLEPDCQGCADKNDVIGGYERELQTWMIRCRNLERDLAREAREHPMWPAAKRLHAEWQRLCAHPKSPWTVDRFWQVEPFLTNPKYAPLEQGRIDLCRRAIAGAAFDAFVTKRRNGTTKRHDDWDLIFRNSSKFEEFCCRAPTGWTP